MFHTVLRLLKSLYLNILSKPKYGTVNITVTDPLSRPISGATIQIIALNITTITDSTGKAVLRKVPYGTQVINIKIYT
jgi:hypothetical protein